MARYGSSPMVWTFKRFVCRAPEMATSRSPCLSKHRLSHEMQPNRLAQASRLALKLASSFLLLTAIEGCQEEPTTVSGAITIDGRPLTVPADARGTVVFQ